MNFRINLRNTGAYSFQNSFFYLQFPDDAIVYSHENSVNPALRAALITQRKTRRLVKKSIVFIRILNPPFSYLFSTNFFNFIHNGIDGPNCIRRNNVPNIFANQMQLLKQVIILYGNLLLDEDHSMCQPMLVFYIIIG